MERTSRKIVSSVFSTDSRTYKTSKQAYIIPYGSDTVKAVDILVSFKHCQLVIKVLTLLSLATSLASADDLLLLTSCVYN